MQPRIFLATPHMGGEEQRFVREAFESNYVAPAGPQLDAFEREFCEMTGIRHSVAVSSGTAAMHLALRHIGVGRGDEVFASTLTFIGSISPILFQGGVPVLIDSDEESWNMDPDLLGRELELSNRRGRLPRAVVPTDLYGQCADLERISAICRRYDVPVIVDSAEALGAQYRRVWEAGRTKGEESLQGEFLSAGAGARAAVFSFNGNKIITTSGGGILASDDGELVERARFLSQQARDPAPHYEHTQLGYNYRMSNISAAIGRGQLRVLQKRIEQKRKIFNYYMEALNCIPGIEFMPEAPYGKSTRWLTVVLIDPVEFGVERDSVRLALEAENIEARPVWKPMHLQPVFHTGQEKSRRSAGNRGYRVRIAGGAVSEYLFERGLCLPSGTQMSEADLDRVIETIKRCHLNSKRGFRSGRHAAAHTI